jgi:transcriptional regulator
VQAKGVLILHEEARWKRDHVESLTGFHEHGFPEPWSVQDAPEDYIDKLLKSIVGLEIRLTSLSGKWKLSQNRSQPDVAGVIAGLERHGDTSPEACVARSMAGVATPAAD